MQGPNQLFFLSGAFSRRTPVKLAGKEKAIPWIITWSGKARFGLSQSIDHHIFPSFWMARLWKPFWSQRGSILHHNRAHLFRSSACATECPTEHPNSLSFSESNHSHLRTKQYHTVLWLKIVHNCTLKVHIRIMDNCAVVMKVKVRAKKVKSPKNKFSNDSRSCLSSAVPVNEWTTPATNLSGTVHKLSSGTHLCHKRDLHYTYLKNVGQRTADHKMQSLYYTAAI